MLTVSAPQNAFLNKLKTPYRAYVGGFGSGKTFIGCIDLLNFFGAHPGTTQGYFGISYPSMRDIFYPTFEEAAHMLGFTVVIRESNKEVHVYRNGFFYGTVICRSMDNPASIVGFKISRALVDEIDVLPKDKANKAWNKIVARMRLKIEGVENSIGVTTTPEGFLFVYSKFKKDPTKSYSMVQASTYENEEHLPDNYIETLKETYPGELINAYIDGDFVNLTSGTIYNEFDRVKHNTDVEWNGREALHIGMDFNVCNMSAVIAVIRKGVCYDVDEITGGYDTPSIIRTIQERYQNCQVNIYPDASGKNRNAQGASESSIQLLKQAGFQVFAKNRNPFVKDRILAVNTSFIKKLHFVNVKRCSVHTSNLEQQVYNNAGEPDKTSGDDHTCFTGDTKVMTDKGLVEIKEMPESGFVYSPTGKLVRYHSKRITGYNKRTISIIFNDLSIVKCTPEHKFLTGEGKWLAASELTGKTCASLLKQYKSSKAQCITSREAAANAVRSLLSTNIIKEKTVLSVAEGKADDVYCLTVDSAGCFALGNGVIVSNCDAIGYLIHYKYPVIKPTTTATRMIV